SGSWSGSPTAFAYQWQRCNALGGSCKAIAGASASSYQLAEADAASTVRVVVTASNPSGHAAATSATSAVVAPTPVPLAPTNTSAPTISGSAAQGQTLTEAHGTWTGEPTGFTYQWLRCDGSGGGCYAIYRATSQTYVPIGGDVGHTLRVEETATNAAGASNPEGSGASPVVAGLANAATFGMTTVGASGDGGLFSNYVIVNKATLGTAGSVSELSVYAIPGLGAPAPQALKAVIYADAGGTPGALLATGSEALYAANVNGTGWFSLPLAAPVSLQPGTYWIGFITGATSEGMGYAYDSVESSRAYVADPFSAGPANPFGTATLDSEQASIYATYVPGG
ncbi:MAG TPA: hypothetical protein VNZ05_10450, partial [Solirubrobacteraceae bacterium]|nr:hypothetical protein [Solirubrobacteraceae bacterium]